MQVGGGADARCAMETGYRIGDSAVDSDGRFGQETQIGGSDKPLGKDTRVGRSDHESDVPPGRRQNWNKPVPMLR